MVLILGNVLTYLAISTFFFFSKKLLFRDSRRFLCLSAGDREKRKKTKILR